MIIHILQRKIVPQNAYLSIIRNLILRASFSDKDLLHFLLKNKQFLPQFKKKLEVTNMEEKTGPLLIIPEEHNIALKFKDDHLPDDHSNVLKRYKSDLILLTSPILPENHCSKKLLQLMTREDKVIWDLIETKKTNRPMGIYGAYMKNFAKDLHVKDDLLFLDNKLVVTATIRGTFNTMLHETHPGQFGMKLLAEYMWWPHIYREIYQHEKSCSQCLKADKGKLILSSRQASNWELHDGAEDWYLDEEKDNPSDPEDNIILAQTIPSPTTAVSHKQPRGSETRKKLVAGGKLYRRAINRKNGEPYFNLVKKDIIDFSYHTMTLNNGHILRKSDLAIKGKLLSGPKNIMVNQPPIRHKSHSHSSLAGKRKLSPSKKTLVTATPQPRQGISGAGGLTQSSDTPTGAETTQDLIQISSGSSSSLNLNPWYGIIYKYFDDETNTNLPPSHQSESNQG